MKKPTNKEWKAFAERIIEKSGNPSFKDAKECGIPYAYFNELCMRNISAEQLIKNAKTIPSKIKEV